MSDDTPYKPKGAPIPHPPVFAPMRDAETGMPAVITENIGKFALDAVGAAFIALGGQARYNQWADENPDDFYNKHFLKLVPSKVETTQRTVDDVIIDLDEEDFRIVRDAPAPTDTETP